MKIVKALCISIACVLLLAACGNSSPKLDTMIKETPIGAMETKIAENSNDSPQHGNAPYEKPKSLEEVHCKIQKHILSVENIHEDRLAEEINRWADAQVLEEKGFWGHCVKAEKTNNALPNVYLMNYSRRLGASEGYAVFWKEGNTLKFQTFPIDNQSQNGFAESMTVISARVARGKTNSLEMGAVFDGLGYGNGGWAKPCPVYKLLKLKNEKWDLLWSSPGSGQPGDEWQNNHGQITFLKDDISEFMLEGDSLFFTDGKEKVLAQTKSGRLRYIQQTWVRREDGYALKQQKSAPSTYNTLIEFIFSISKGQRAAAARYVGNEKLISTAKDMKMLQQSLDEEWWVIYPQDSFTKEEFKKQNPLILVLDPEGKSGVKVSFISKGEEFLVSDLEAISISGEEN